MDRKDQRLTAAGLLVAAAFVLSACGEDEPTPRVENRPSAAETTPAAADDETPEEFIRRWFKASERMQNTGDATEYEAMSQACANCTEMANRVRGYYAAGGSVSFKGHDIRSIEPYLGDANRFLVKNVVRPTVYRTASAAPEQRFDGGREDYVVTLEKTADGWRVLESTVLVQ